MYTLQNIPFLYGRMFAQLLLAAVSSDLAGADNLVVNTSAGALRGFAINSTRLFLGVPYAEPPTGPLRWRAPRPKAGWSGVRDARSYGAACMQPGNFDPPIDNLSEGVSPLAEKSQRLSLHISSLACLQTAYS